MRIILPLKPESELMLDDGRSGLPAKCFNRAGTGKIRGKKTRVKARGGEHRRPLANSFVPASV